MGKGGGGERGRWGKGMRGKGVGEGGCGAAYLFVYGGVLSVVIYRCDHHLQNKYNIVFTKTELFKIRLNFFSKCCKLLKVSRHQSIKFYSSHL